MKDPICFECAVEEADRLLAQSAKDAGVELSRLSYSERSFGFMVALSVVMKDREIISESCRSAARIRARIATAQLN